MSGMSDSVTERRKLDHEERKDKRHGRARLIIALFVGFLVAYAWFRLFMHDIPEGNKEVLIALVSAVTGSLLTIVAFYFGDSDGKGGGGA